MRTGYLYDATLLDSERAIPDASVERRVASERRLEGLGSQSRIRRNRIVQGRYAVRQSYGGAYQHAVNVERQHTVVDIDSVRLSAELRLQGHGRAYRSRHFRNPPSLREKRGEGGLHGITS